MTEPWKDFVHTGPGTLAGRFLRTFWQPVYRAQDLPAGRAVPIEIMGERFTLYRGESGAPHLAAFRCAHRGTQLSSGWIEGDAIRCRYHGWKYDATGRCVEQPGEDESFAAKVSIRSYPVEEYLGLLFAYLGEGDPPPLRRFPDFEEPGVLTCEYPQDWPCNYFNRLDNACDTGHVVYTHRLTIQRAARHRGRDVAAQELASPVIACEESEYGIRTASAVPGSPPHYFHFHMPNINQIRSRVRVDIPGISGESFWEDRLFWRVPINDERSISYAAAVMKVPEDQIDAFRQRKQEVDALVTSPLRDVGDAILDGRVAFDETDEGLGQYALFWIDDYVVQTGQGPIADRDHERLGQIDRGVILLRRLWERELRALYEGRPIKEWREPGPLAAMSKPEAVWR